MERCKIRRLGFVDDVFSPPTTVEDGYDVRLVRVDPERFLPARPLGLISDRADDVLVVPGLLAAVRGSVAERRLRARDDATPVDVSSETVAVYRVAGEGVEAVIRGARVLAEVQESDPEHVGLVHGFVAHQRMLAPEDPERAAPLDEPRDRRRGAGRRIVVLDTGLADEPAWPGLTSGASDVDPLESATHPGFLGRAAGHGTFVAALCHEVAPGASVVVRRVGNTEGFVDELTVTAALEALGRDGDPPDVVVTAFGGYAVKRGSFGTSGGSGWSRPELLRGALSELLARCPDLVVVASAGNNQSSDPCYPAAFAAEREFAGRVVAVAALDAGGYRAAFSNYGSWVSASTLGVRLHGPYVPGREHPANDPDGRPETFAAPAFAQWSGTSFAAPLVAGRIVELQWALGEQERRRVAATEAWRVLRAASKAQREGLCGVHVLVDGVAHD